MNEYKLESLHVHYTPMIEDQTVQLNILKFFTLSPCIYGTQKETMQYYKVNSTG